MGRKRPRRGQFIFLCIAGLIFFLLSGCTTLKNLLVPPREAPAEKVQKQPERPKPAWESLERAAQLLKRGDYDGSLKENQRALSLGGKNPPSDRALFNIGLIYSHEENPKKDHEKSLFFFTKVIKDYPQSTLVEEANIWIKVLRENERLRAVIEKFKEVDMQVEEKKREKAR
jgi:tetratricopeptide (TPR) repeat protein